MKERVQKIMAQAGVASRRQCEELIKEGKVYVNGKVIKLGDKADADDEIRVGSRVIKPRKKIYLVMNKPRGVITTTRDDRKKITDLVEENVFPVGRLDRDVEGLIFLTNDGDFANKIMHPRYMVKKTYRVMLDQPLKKGDKIQLEKGVRLQDGKTAPAEVKMQGKKMLDLSIHEGKKKIVKRMFKKLGYNVNRLRRIKIGSVSLQGIKVGRYRQLRKSELKEFI